MNHKYIAESATVLVVLFAFAVFAPSRASAHCDGVDGPVVKAAEKALGTSNASLVLIWVQKEDEAEIRAAFQKTLSVPQAWSRCERSRGQILLRNDSSLPPGQAAPHAPQLSFLTEL